MYRTFKEQTLKEAVQQQSKMLTQCTSDNSGTEFFIRIRALLICHKGIMAHLVHLSICAIANDLDQLEDSCWILVKRAAV